jgi:5'-nucleotidase
MPSDKAVRALLSSPLANISLRDRDEVLKKASALAQAGVSDLHIIADFDFTLTRFRLEDGERSASTHACIETYKGLSQDYRMATRKLFEHYYPIEVSDIPYEDKRKAMVEWWTQVSPGHRLPVLWASRLASAERDREREKERWRKGGDARTKTT